MNPTLVNRLVIFAALLVLCFSVLGPGALAASAQEGGSGNPMDMTPEGAKKTPEGAGKSPKDDSGATQLGGPNTGLTNDNLKDEAKKKSDDEQAKKDGESPPTEDCGMVDPGCWTNNALITFVWWIIRAPALFIEELITGFESIGFALPDPSGPLLDKYDQVAEKVRPMVLVGMLIMGGLMLARSARYTTAYLLQNGLPKIGLAVLGLAFFPQFATLLADISNGIAESFYKDAEVTKMFVELIKETILADLVAFLAVLVTPAGWTILGVMALVFLAPVLILILLLFVITYMNGLFFSLLILTGPIALVCYAVPGLDSVTETWFKGILASAVLPIIFSIEIMLMSWAGVHPDAIGPAGGTASLVVCVLLLWVMVKTPGKVYHWAFGSMGGGHGGGFLAGMGMRSLLRKGAQVAAGAATGGIGAAAAGAGAAGAAASSSARVATGGAGVKSVASNLAKSSHGSWGGERIKQHGATRSFNNALNTLKGEEGAFQGLRQSGESHLGTKNKIAELNSQVHGGELPKEAADKQIQDLEEGQKDNNEILANNLAAEYGGEPGDYKALINAEQASQEQGKGSQVGALESPRAPKSAIPEGTEPSEAEQLQEYTARITDTGDNTGASQEEPSEEKSNVAPTNPDQQIQAGSNPQISDAEKTVNTNPEPQIQAGSNPQASDTEQTMNTDTGYAPAQTGDQSPPKGHPAVADSSQHPGASQPEAAEAGFSPPRYTEAAMDDSQKGKAEKVNAMLGSDPDANRSYQRALQDDTKLRGQQGAVHHEAMKGNISAKDAKKAVASIQQDRDKNLQASANELGKRLHNSPHAPAASEKNPVAPKDVRQILGNKFDYAYDNPSKPNVDSSPSWGSFHQERVMHNDGDGGMDGNGAGSGHRASRGLRNPYSGSSEEIQGGRDKDPNSVNDNAPDWHRPAE